MAIVLGLDLGLAHTGGAMFELEGADDTLLKIGVIKTEKAGNAEGRVAEDNYRRLCEVARWLRDFVDGRRVSVVCVESMSFVRNASAAAKMAMVWGILAAMTSEHQVPVIMASPQDIKKAICGARDASKDDIQKGVAKIFPRLAEDFAGLNKTLREHPADAVGAFYALRHNPIVMMARGLA
jgi:crossover junction endodeoxyribonuclease RuvC